MVLGLIQCSDKASGLLDVLTVGASKNLGLLLDLLPLRIYLSLVQKNVISSLIILNFMLFKFWHSHGVPDTRKPRSMDSADSYLPGTDAWRDHGDQVSFLVQSPRQYPSPPGQALPYTGPPALL